MAPTLLLDLDGTLIDTVPDLTAAVNRLMRSRGLGEFSVPEVTRMVGDGVAVLTRRAFAARGREPDAEAVADFVTDYTAHVAVDSKPYPGVVAALTDLSHRGWRLAICTNKPERPARELLGLFGLLPLMAAVGGGDSFPVRKPDPGHLLATLKQAGGTVDAAVLLGDHHNDVEAGRAAGIPVIFAAWGYGTPAMGEDAAAVAGDIADAARIAHRLLP